LSRSGEIYLIAAGTAWHAGNTVRSDAANNYSIGIEAEATGVDAWPANQYLNFAAMCRALCDYYKLPVANVLGHKEVCSPPGRKIDPNFDMSAFRRQCASGGAPILKPKVRELDMIERAIVPTDTRQFMRIVAPVGNKSQTAGKAYISISCGGGFNADVGFQMNADTDNAPPGAGPMWHAAGQNGNRRWAEVPNGTEYLDIWYTAKDHGSILVEFIPK
jgi:hypothetical protein